MIIFKEKIFRKKAPVTLVRNSKRLVYNRFPKPSEKAELLALQGKTGRLQKEINNENSMSLKKI